MINLSYYIQTNICIYKYICKYKRTNKSVSIIINSSLFINAYT
jgi:hypothetical protein